MKKLLISALCAVSLINTGCAPKLGGSDYSVGDVGDVAISTPGVVVGRRVIQINAHDNTNPGAGAGVGAGVGALAGSAFGNGRGQLVGMGLGALAGGVAGHFAEGALKNQEGFEYQVRVEATGEVLTVSQGG
ncbi:MAG: glycine zipper 2TM domain-containing protein, partial [Alphaproteobacteria bacterium]|nr:glycine zipper 2TM domain-containing protein [Alphaproteobacteria bacterium]